MADIDILRDELDNDPEGIGYSGMSDPVAANALNTQNRPSNKTIPVQTLHAWFVFAGKWPSIETTAAATAGGGGPTANQKLAAQSFIEICHHFGDLDMLDPQYSSGILFCLNEFVTRGIITSAQRTEIIALSASTVSRAEELGIGIVSHLDVAEARNG